MTEQPISIFKLILVGDCGTGKSTFLRRQLTGEFVTTYRPTRGVDGCSLTFQTNRGKICFNCWDVSGRCKGLPRTRISDANCALIMFDVTSRQTYKSVYLWYIDVVRMFDSIPIILVGNKIDQPARDVNERMIDIHRKKAIQYYDIDAKTNANCDEPFIGLARHLLNEPDLYFIRNTSCIPCPPAAKAEVTAEEIAAMEAEIGRLESDFELCEWAGDSESAKVDGYEKTQFENYQ